MKYLISTVSGILIFLISFWLLTVAVSWFLKNNPIVSILYVLFKYVVIVALLYVALVMGAAPVFLFLGVTLGLILFVLYLLLKRK